MIELLPPAKLLYRLDEAADVLTVSISTVRRYIDERHLDVIILPGGHRRVTRDSLLKRLEQKQPNAPKSY